MILPPPVRPSVILRGRAATIQSNLGLSSSTTSWSSSSLKVPQILSSDGRVDPTRKAVIRTPVAIQKKVLKRSSKILFGRMDRFEGERDRPVITCRRTELNHYYRQTYSKVDKIPLASEHWQSRRTHGDFFTFNAWGSPRHKEKTRTIPELLSGKSLLVAAETGNGKTLAFLAPLLHQAVALKAELKGERLLNAPFALVVTPGRELAKQIFHVAQDLGAPLGVQVGMELGGRNRATVLAGTRREMDVLVGTFGAVDRLLEEGYYRRDRLRHAVLDEADTLLDDTFNEETVPFLARLGLEDSLGKRNKSARRRRRSDAAHLQLTLSCATYPTSLSSILSGVCDVDDLSTVTTGRLHVVPPHVRQTFVRCRRVGREDYLMHFLSPDLDRGRQCVVFSNKSATSSYLAQYLRSQGIKCEAFNSSRTAQQREDALRGFLLGEVSVLSCTDLASRGLDTSNVHHVINYEFPLNMSDYIHRVGRAGRVGSPQGAKVTNLVGGKIQVRLVQMLEESVRTQREIPNVNNNIIRIIRHRHNRNKTYPDPEADHRRDEELSPAEATT